MNKRERKYVSVLERRADHLARRIAEAEAVNNDRSFDKQELAAINWAIRILSGGPVPPPSVDMPEDGSRPFP